MKENPKNAETDFVIDFKVDETIMGGLQMYTESEFMDMSLSSRLDRLNNEIQKMIDWAFSFVARPPSWAILSLFKHLMNYVFFILLY